jgi:hypothetical protein
MQVVMGHQPVARRIRQPRRDVLSATVCKAACIDTQQTVKNDVNFALASNAVFAAISTIGHPSKPACDLHHMLGHSA